MDKFIKKNIVLIIAIFVLLNPILDLATGVCLHYFHLSLTIGIIIRILFFISICLITLLVYKKTNLIKVYMIIGLYFILHIIGVFVYKEGVGLFTEIQNLIKVFYFPTLLISLYEIREDIRISKLTLFTVLFFYLILIFIPSLFHLGYQTYEITKVGTLGFFNSANEISGIISILTPIMFYILSTSRKWIPRILFMGMYLVVILMMGTKTPLLSFCITLGLSLTYLWIHLWKKKEYKKVGLSIGVLILGLFSLLLILPRTNFYKNIQVHLEFLKLDSIHEVFLHKETIDHFIFSQRLTFLHDKALVYKEAPFYEKIFGIGYLREGREIKQIEMDYFDIYYNYGIAGFILFFSITIYVLYKLMERKPIMEYERYMVETSSMLIFFLAFFTGHILTTPAVAILCILILFSLQNYQKRQVLFITNNPSKLDFLKELESDNCTISTYLYKEGIIHYLWFKIIHYQRYDLSIYEEEAKEYGMISSKRYLQLSYHKKKEEKDKRIVSKKDLLENIDYYLKKEKKRRTQSL